MYWNVLLQVGRPSRSFFLSKLCSSVNFSLLFIFRLKKGYGPPSPHFIIHSHILRLPVTLRSLYALIYIFIITFVFRALTFQTKIQMTK